MNRVTALLLWTEIHKQWRIVINTHICPSVSVFLRFWERGERKCVFVSLNTLRVCRNEEWLIISTNRKKLVTLRTRRCHADTLDIEVLLAIGDKIIKSHDTNKSHVTRKPRPRICSTFYQTGNRWVQTPSSSWHY